MESSSVYGAMTLSRTTFFWISKVELLSIACCFVVGLGLLLELVVDLASGSLVVMYAYLLYTTFRCHCTLPTVMCAAVGRGARTAVNTRKQVW